MRYRKRSSGEILEYPAPVVTFDVSAAWERVDDVADTPVEPAEPAEVPLEARKRGELDELAASLGVEDPEKLPNKGAVVDAIEAKQAENDTEDELG